MTDQSEQVYDIEARAELLLHLSKISRLEGQVQALIETAAKQARRIRKLEDGHHTL